MHSLAELQRSFARAVTSGDRAALVAELRADAGTATRLAIHFRHYDASLTNALIEKYPACAWLLGPSLVRDAARAYVRARPPSEPCIAEYGWDFPAFLAGHGRACTLPYVETFAALELAVAQASIEVDRPPLAWQALSSLGPERLLDTVLVLQPGLRYVRSAWRVDALMATYLRGTAPERFELEKSAAHIEVRGARGEVDWARLDDATFLFRAELAAGRTIAEAADAALDLTPTFDPGIALRELVEAGLVVGAREPQAREPA
jgi:hypothetical protein